MTTMRIIEVVFRGIVWRSQQPTKLPTRAHQFLQFSVFFSSSMVHICFFHIQGCPPIIRKLAGGCRKTWFNRRTEVCQSMRYPFDLGGAASEESCWLHPSDTTILLTLTDDLNVTQAVWLVMQVGEMRSLHSHPLSNDFNQFCTFLSLVFLSESSPLDVQRLNNI